MTTAEKIAVMQAFEDGKSIQYRVSFFANDGLWYDYDQPEQPSWNWGMFDYRVKPEYPKAKKPAYRPYKDSTEMAADFKERFGVKVPPYSMPLIWLSNKDVPEYNLVTDYDFGDGVCTSDMGWDFKELLERFTYLDGSPVGKLVEE